MGKLVDLEYRLTNGMHVIERVVLMEETDAVLHRDHGEMRNEDGSSLTVADIITDQVLFEDEDGIFALPPRCIVHIETVQD